MSWAASLRKLAISWPLALLAALLLLAVNEAGYLGSREALQSLLRSHAERSLLEQLQTEMLNAETGQRGFLLMGEERYLQPYTRARARIGRHMEALQGSCSAHPQEREDCALLLQLLERRLGEMDTTIGLRRQDNEDAWRFMLSTDEGQQRMDDVRTVVARMIDRNATRSQEASAAIDQSLTLSRAGIAVGALLSLLAFYVYRRQARALQQAQLREQQILERERARLEQLVRERTASLSELARHLQQVREDERAHLARELHDELGALLTAAKLDLARLRARIDLSVPEKAERLEHLSQTLNSVIALKRDIIEDLHPSSLTNLGLTASLEVLTSEFAASSQLPVQTHLETVALSPTAQLTAYRLVQEALTNIAKHARARHVEVRVERDGARARVLVRDDGLGFHPQQLPAHTHGLFGMRHRVEAEGGVLQIDSAPGAGTVVSATLPLAGSAGTT
ncbi:CHASE3 domain-containing protein [Melaminivora alkalimesophila]|uniref:Signal transduction histidine kinase n=1 Tax=Melaminivora alkalimesophila TaxID=1165852 RepID=A0A317RE96_9BURK|nr:CHASE3 domain-containing protein [Melaminivora alkalimesophila]PWW47825.1 signal transduction histidine kinase [Melaminivora alkalimesophila]